MAFKSVVSLAVGLTPVTVYTPPAGKVATLIDISCANILLSEVKGTVILSKGGVTDAHLIKDGPIPAGGSMIVSGNPRKIVAEEGDNIDASCDTALGMDVTISILEQDA